ncbi:uncharacterized protein LOC133715383 [Rosa rugosa]|uniref:uncharacterized protein LOC133715383 n=1 Tax=Rosa rugosa TaxID=74645 RepID=UPI002B400B50|nr:uncharacterized protein LOC133715383 [Rosa rugosa]
MPLSGNEETGVKPVTWKSSDYIAGVPIKKRRFPMMRPPSPPPEEPSFPPSKMDSVQKEQSSQSQGSTISHASVATSSGISDATKASGSDDRRGSSDVKNVNMVQGNDNTVRVKVEQPSLRDHLGSSDDLQRKGKFVMADNPAPQMTLGRNELNLRPTEAPVSSLSKDIMHSKHRAEMKCKEEMPAIAEGTELSLALKERLFPSLTGQKSDSGVSHPSQDKSEPISLNLSLSKEKISVQCKGKDRDLKVHGAQLQACRANWDLNTPMDAWGDSVNDAPVSVDRISAKGGGHAVSSIGMVEGGVSSERQSNVESHKRTNLTMLSKLDSQQYKPNDSLLLRLSSSCSLPNLCQTPSSSIAFELDRRTSAVNLPRVAGPTSNLNLGNHITVKPEPFDERVKQEPSSMGPLNIRAGKHGVVERSTVGAVHSSNVSTQKFVDPRSIKSEPALELNQEMSKSTKGKSVQLDKHVINGPDDRPFDMKLPVAAEISRPAGKPSCLTESTGQPSCSTELTVTQDVINHSGDSNGRLPHEACQSNEKVAISLGHDSKVNNMRTKDDNVDSQSCKLKLMIDQPLDSRGSGGTSDEEKINISTDMLEDSYGTDYESDGNHAIDTAIETKEGGKDDDYEDGEVRDLLLDTAVQDELISESREVENANHDDFDNGRTECVGPVDIVHHTSFHVEAKDNKTDNLAGTSNNDHEESADIDLNIESDKGCDNDVCLQEASFVEKLTCSEGMKGSISTVTIEPLNDQSGKRDSQKCQDAELSSEQVTIGSQGTAVASAQDTELNVNKTEPVLTSDSTLSKTSGSGDNATKDTSNGGQRSRIITLPRSLNGSPTRSRSIPDQPFPSRAGREILPAVTPDDNKLHPRGRGETYVDDTYRFPRERYQDQSWRNSVNFRRGRGRMNNRGDWSSDRYFAAERYYNQTKYRVPRHKYVNVVSDADLEYNNYNMASDGAFVGRGGRKLSNDGPINHRIPSRRRSPVGGPIIHVPRRNPRNFSPSRCIGEDTSDLVGMRHNEKLMRGFPDDSVDPMFNRTQPSYEGDGQFGRGRGNRTFSFVQQRGIRVRSKSPIRTRTRSPVPWSSPRRRSPDGFGGPGELSHRTPNYRMERFRSPDGASFTGEMVVRRNPPNDLRDMDTVRDHGHQRSGIHRSPSSRVLLRNRRFDVIDPRERADNNEFFAGGGPMHSGRLHELGGDGNADERRRFGERRGPVRTFRPPYNSADGETFHVNTEDGPRPFRFCPDGETEFQERGNLRERDFDRRIKNRPGNAPRRMRSIEDQEGNFRSDGQPWNDGGFDDISRAKRKRF